VGASLPASHSEKQKAARIATVMYSRFARPQADAKGEGKKEGQGKRPVWLRPERIKRRR